MSLTPIQSVSGYLYDKLNDAIPTSFNEQESKLKNLKITLYFVGTSALLVASIVETTLRYFIAFSGVAVSFALKDESFKNDYAKPAFEHAKINKDKFFEMKQDLVAEYNVYIKPFLENPVELPSS